MDRSEFREIPNMEQNTCFGCGPKNENGLQMTFYGNDKMVYSEIILPEYMTGWKNITHGGILATVLDECMGRCAMLMLRKFPFTKSMTIDYIKPVMAGEKLRIESEIKEHLNDKEVCVVGRVFSAKGKLSTTSSSTMYMVDTEFVKKLGIMNDKELEDFKYMLNFGEGGV